MRSEMWEARAAQLSEFSGAGLTIKEVAFRAGLTPPTVKRYANIYGLQFGRFSTCPAEKGETFRIRVEAIKEAAAEGKTRAEIAAELGLDTGTVSTYGKKHGISFVHARTGFGVDFSRAEVMASMYKSGKTLIEIGTIYGVSRERVRQIVKKYHGMTSKNGGHRVKAAAKSEKVKASIERKCLETKGCSHAQWRDLVELGKEMQRNGVTAYRTPTKAFANQRNNAIGRGLEWKMKLWEWWSFWQESGKWDERGRGADLYVMCRFADAGAYEIGNVYIATLSHNSSVQPNNPYRKGHPRHDEVMGEIKTRAKAAPRKHPRKTTRVRKYDLPTGVSFHKTSGRYAAQICINGKPTYLGMAATPELAHVKYLDALAMIDGTSAPSKPVKEAAE